MELIRANSTRRSLAPNGRACGRWGFVEHFSSTETEHSCTKPTLSLDLWESTSIDSAQHGLPADLRGSSLHKCAES
jgi:hypothetical protein